MTIQRVLMADYSMYQLFVKLHIANQAGKKAN